MALPTLDNTLKALVRAKVARPASEAVVVAQPTKSVTFYGDSIIEFQVFRQFQTRWAASSHASSIASLTNIDQQLFDRSTAGEFAWTLLEKIPYDHRVSQNVVLHVGINDILNGRDPTEVIKQIIQLYLSQTFTLKWKPGMPMNNPGGSNFLTGSWPTKVLVSLMHPCAVLTTAQNNMRVGCNNSIRAYVNSNTYGGRLAVVDYETLGLDTASYDGLHVSATYGNNMAGRILTSLNGMLT